MSDQPTLPSDRTEEEWASMIDGLFSHDWWWRTYTAATGETVQGEVCKQCSTAKDAPAAFKPCDGGAAVRKALEADDE